MTNRNKTIAVYIISAVLVAAVLLTIAYAYGALRSHPLQNITLGDVKALVPQASYAIMNSTNTSLTGYFSSEGYKSIMVSEFNASSDVKYTSYPQFITSIIYTANSPSSALSIEKDFLLLNFSNTYTPNSLASQYSYQKSFNYQSGGHNVTMYNIYDVAVFNLSAVSKYSEEFPIFQYTTLFTYGNYTIFVAEDGYSGLNGTIPSLLAEKLFSRIAASS